MTPPILATDGGNVGVPMVFESRFARNGRGAPDVVAPPLKAQSGSSGRGDGAPLLATWIAVRRLTPRECERLQGLSRRLDACPELPAETPSGGSRRDGLLFGNRARGSRPIGRHPGRTPLQGNRQLHGGPVMRWIGQRIDHVDRVLMEAA